MAELMFEHSEEVRRVAARIISTIPSHGHLAAAKIAYLKRISTDGWKSKGYVVLAQVRKPSPVDRFLTDYDLVLTVNNLAWEQASEQQKEALIDHEFCHVTPEWTITGHDLEEFVSVVRRHGLWKEGLEKLVEAAQAHGYDLQLNLPMVDTPLNDFDNQLGGIING